MFSDRIKRGRYYLSNPSHESKYLRGSRSKMNPRESRSIWDVTLHNQDGLGNAKRVRDMLLAMETGVLIQGSGR